MRLSLSVAVLAAILMAACGGSITQTVVQPTVPTITALPSLDEMLSDKALGSASAPNTIIEYVSFWCSGCKDYYLTGDGSQFKSQFVDTGRAQVILRNLFLNGETLNAAMLARCAGTARFFDAVDTIYRNQPTWLNASNPDTAVSQVMLGFGMSQNLINSCVSNTQLQNGLAQIHTNALAATYTMPDGSTVAGFTHVPAIVVNGTKLDSTLNADGTVNPDNAPTLANIQKYLK